ncbi:gap-Pol polyprotein, partial [Clonorchis sinensis]
PAAIARPGLGEVPRQTLPPDKFVKGALPALTAQLRFARATGQLSVEHLVLLAWELAEAPLITLQSQEKRTDSPVEDLKIKIDGKRALRLTDTGAGVSLRRTGKEAECIPCALAVRSVGGYRLKIDGLSMHSMRLGDESVQHAFSTSPDMEQAILGADILRSETFCLVTCRQYALDDVIVHAFNLLRQQSKFLRKAPLHILRSTGSQRLIVSKLFSSSPRQWYFVMTFPKHLRLLNHSERLLVFDTLAYARSLYAVHLPADSMSYGQRAKQNHRRGGFWPMCLWNVFSYQYSQVYQKAPP